MSSQSAVRLKRALWASAVCTAFAGLSACGGGSGSSSPPPPSWTAGVFQPSSHYVAQCHAPRSGKDPITGMAYPDMQGTTLDENNWLRSWTNELYLWYLEVPDQDPGLFSTTAAYFDVLKTPATTSTGKPKDRFHFTYPTSQWEQMSQAGVDIGYGLTWAIIAGTPPRQVYASVFWPGAAPVSAGV